MRLQIHKKKDQQKPMTEMLYGASTLLFICGCWLASKAIHTAVKVKGKLYNIHGKWSTTKKKTQPTTPADVYLNSSTK